MKEWPQHLKDLLKECETVTFGSTRYWYLRCHYLEKSIDTTYLRDERNNCNTFYSVLQKRTK